MTNATPTQDDRRWVAAIATCAAFAIVAKLTATEWMYWVFKPLATILIAGLALRRGSGIYARTVFVGLLLSLAGDVLLIPPGLFIGGLVAFLAAHVAYLFAFTREARFAAHLRPFVAVAAIALAILAVLWPRLPAGLGIPVLAYVTMLGAIWPRITTAQIEMNAASSAYSMMSWPSSSRMKR